MRGIGYRAGKSEIPHASSYAVAKANAFDPPSPRSIRLQQPRSGVRHVMNGVASGGPKVTEITTELEYQDPNADQNAQT